MFWRSQLSLQAANVEYLSRSSRWEMGSGKPRPRAVRRPSEVRLGFDAFESRSTLADLGSLSRNTTFSDTASAFCCACIHRDLRSTVAQRKQKTGAYSFMNVELPRPFYISSWDKCQTFSFTCCAQLPAGIPVFQKGKEILTFRQREVGVRCWSPDPENL